MRLQGNTPLETLRRTILFIITIAVTFFVIFFLWIPLLIIVCVFLLIAFIFRKKMSISSFNSFGKKKNVYATWNAHNYKNPKNNAFNKNECVDAEFINLDKNENEQ